MRKYRKYERGQVYFGKKIVCVDGNRIYTVFEGRYKWEYLSNFSGWITDLTKKHGSNRDDK